MSEMNTENRPVALRISGVKKMYKLGQIGGGSLQADLQSWWAKKRGKDQYVLYESHMQGGSSRKETPSDH